MKEECINCMYIQVDEALGLLDPLRYEILCDETHRDLRQLGDATCFRHNRTWARWNRWMFCRRMKQKETRWKASREKQRRRNMAEKKKAVAGASGLGKKLRVSPFGSFDGSNDSN